MSHLAEETLVLHYYGELDEPQAAERHLDECPECREFYGSVARALNLADAVPAPERGPEYGARVWARIEDRMQPRRAWLPGFRWRWAAAGAVFAGLLAVAFLAGRFYPLRHAGGLQASAAADAQVRERILLVAVGDYLERSQMVLVELANAGPGGPLDITEQQARAGDLVSEARLYRQTAAHTGDANMAGVLEELERVLVHITHEPSRLSAEGIEKLRERLNAEGILFKIRVLGANVNSEEAPAPRPGAAI